MIPVYDKYAAYIWACFGFSVVALLLLLVVLVLRARATRQELALLDARREGRRHG